MWFNYFFYVSYVPFVVENDFLDILI